MTKAHNVVTSFGDAEVRRKTQDNVPLFLREWESVPARQSFLPRKWNSLERRINAPGYPPFDIYSHWLMDFATIAAGQLGRGDWQNYRRMLLVHVYECPLYCWYCFNDAWEENSNVTVGGMQASEIVAGFRTYREKHKNPDGEKVKTLRISGGEPFTNPLLVADIAETFGRLEDADDTFLWVDTNLVPFPEKPSEAIEKALKAISSLRNRAAVHACIHGVNPDSFYRNTRLRIDADRVKRAIELFLHHNVRVYPRLNPIALTPLEIEAAFELLAGINHDLPLKTYLGPVALLYEHTIDRMKAFQGLPPLFAPAVKGLPDRQKPGIPSFNPANAGIFTWNRLLERHYGVGYATFPRHVDAHLKPLPKDPGGEFNAEWHNFVLICQGWKTEDGAAKTPEAIGAPHGSIVDMQLENRRVEPAFLAHAFTCPGFYTEREVYVLVAAVQKGQKGVPPDITPLRWGRIRKISAEGCGSESRLGLQVEMLGYADDFSLRMVSNGKMDVFEYLAYYCGAGNLPFYGQGGFLAQYIGIELLRGSH